MISAYIKAAKSLVFVLLFVGLLGSLQIASVTLSTEYLCCFVFKYSDLYKTFDAYSIVDKILLRKKSSFPFGVFSWCWTLCILRHVINFEIERLETELTPNILLSQISNYFFSLCWLTGSILFFSFFFFNMKWLPLHLEQWRFVSTAF